MCLAVTWADFILEGAARVALEKFGSVWGKDVGLKRQSYAIPTMHGGVDVIKPHVDKFIAFARKHRELKLLVTPIGCGIAGFTIGQIAPRFAAVINDYNIILPEDFVKVIDR